MGADRKTDRGGKLLLAGLLITVIGGGLRWFAIRYINDNPVLVMGAAISNMFDSTRHLTFQERAIFFLADYGTQISLAGVGVMILALALRRQ